MQPDEQQFLKSNGISIVRPIAKGSYGVVYYVYHEDYKSNFALKKIPQKLFNQAEVDILIAFDNPHKVNLYHYYLYENSIYLLMEYCPGDLTVIFKPKVRIPHDLFVRYIRDVVLSVKCCHDQNIAHCDIKPSNFLVDQYGRVKITDFGLSGKYNENEKSDVFLGTKLFMSPEILNHRAYNPIAADIWALGVTLYYLATRTFPFESDYEELFRHNIEHSIYKSDLIDDALLRDVIARCLDPNPLQRPSTDILLKMPFFEQHHPKPYYIPPTKSMTNGIFSNGAILQREQQPKILQPKVCTKSLSGMMNRHILLPRVKLIQTNRV